MRWRIEKTRFVDDAQEILHVEDREGQDMVWADLHFLHKPREESSVVGV